MICSYRLGLNPAAASKTRLPTPFAARVVIAAPQEIRQIVIRVKQENLFGVIFFYKFPLEAIKRQPRSKFLV